MEIRQLLYFTAIAEEGTISGAARRLHLSQPPLSRQLQLLEEELGCQLFRRDTRHMELTEAGELLYARSRESLRSLGDIKREMADISLGKGGKLSLGVVSSVSGRLLPGWIRHFHELDVFVQAIPLSSVSTACASTANTAELFVSSAPNTA